MKQKSKKIASDSRNTKKQQLFQPKTSSSSSKNKVKCFWKVEMNSFSFNAAQSKIPHHELLKLTQTSGEYFFHYCSLGLLVEKQTENPPSSFILNKRYKNLIAVFGDVKEVTFHEIQQDEEAPIVDYECKIGNNCYGSVSPLISAHKNLTRLAWIIRYKDGSCDVHVMRNQIVRIAGNKKGVQDFNPNETIVNSQLENVKYVRPTMVSCELIPVAVVDHVDVKFSKKSVAEAEEEAVQILDKATPNVKINLICRFLNSLQMKMELTDHETWQTITIQFPKNL